MPKIPKTTKALRARLLREKLCTHIRNPGRWRGVALFVVRPRWGLKLDRTLAGFVALIVTANAVLVFRPLSLQFPIALAVSLLPAVLLWADYRLARLGLALIALPCGMAAYAQCDLANEGSTAILHPLHQGLWVLVPYGLLRTVFWRN